MEDYVPKALLVKSDKNIVELDKASAQIAEWLLAKSAPKGEVASFIKSSSTLGQSTKTLREQIQDLVDEAPAS